MYPGNGGAPAHYRRGADEAGPRAVDCFLQVGVVDVGVAESREQLVEYRCFLRGRRRRVCERQQEVRLELLGEPVKRVEITGLEVVRTADLDEPFEALSVLIEDFVRERRRLRSRGALPRTRTDRDAAPPRGWTDARCSWQSRAFTAPASACRSACSLISASIALTARVP